MVINAGCLIITSKLLQEKRTAGLRSSAILHSLKTLRFLCAHFFLRKSSTHSFDFLHICLIFQKFFLPLQRNITKRGVLSMATPIRPIPVVSGDDAVRFIEAAEAAERNAHKVELDLSREEFDKIMSTAQIY
jgi:hypothetical protein